MKVYKVKVNGKVYEVELESVSEKAGSIAAAAQPAAAPQAASGEGTPLKAPMQGTILNVKVAAGDQVKKGQVLCILEAMKLENEIVSPADGVITQVNISKGQNVNNQELLFVIG